MSGERETWQVVGIVDAGAPTFPRFERITVRFQADAWWNALKMVQGQLQKHGTVLGVDSIVRVSPKPRPLG